MSSSMSMMIGAWLFVLVWIGFVITRQRKHHPRALFYLFLVELWERFSYYGMRALLILFMVRSFHYEDDAAYALYGAYGALVYAMPVVGGLIADRLLGFRKAIFLGAIFMAIGHFLMAYNPDILADWFLSDDINHQYKAVTGAFAGPPMQPTIFHRLYVFAFVGALSFLIIGNGFFKPNISSLVGKFYVDGDPKRDSAFTLFYMGVNTGAFLAPLTCGFIGEEYGWHYGFSLAGIGMLIGIIIFSMGKWSGAYEDKGLPPAPEKIESKFLGLVKLEYVLYVAAVLMIPVIMWLLFRVDIAKKMLAIGGLGILGVLLLYSFTLQKIERERLLVVMVLLLFTVCFWTFFELAGSSITLFTDRNVDRHLFGEEVRTSIFQGVNPFFIIVLAPLFSGIWTYLSVKGYNPSAPQKFSLGLLQLGLGFFVLVFGARIAGPDGLAPFYTLVIAYLLHTTGELCLSPIGLSLVTKLSPKTIVGVVMGVWLLSSTFAHMLGAEISKYTSLPEENGQHVINKVESLHTYSSVFLVIAAVSVTAAVLLWVISPLVKKMMHGVE